MTESLQFAAFDFPILESHAESVPALLPLKIGPKHLLVHLIAPGMKTHRSTFNKFSHSNI